MACKAGIPIRLRESFIESVASERGLAANTLDAYVADLNVLARWLLNAEISILEVRRDDLLRFLEERSKEGSKPRTQARQLSTYRRFFYYLEQQQQILENPTRDISLPSIGTPLPKLLTEREVESLLVTPDVRTPLGFRDRAMLEVLYGAGLRVSEIVSLKLRQVDIGKGMLRVLGKGSVERIIPLGEHANYWLTEYCRRWRRKLLASQKSAYLFPTFRKPKMTRQACWHMIKRHAAAAGIKQSLSPHTLRHAFATHLVNRGANLRAVQMLMGHTHLSTTQIYTHVALDHLKRLHDQHHPRSSTKALKEID